MDTPLPGPVKNVVFALSHSAVALHFGPSAAAMVGKDTGKGCVTLRLLLDHCSTGVNTIGPEMQSQGTDATPGLTVEVLQRKWSLTEYQASTTTTVMPPSTTLQVVIHQEHQGRPQ